MSINRDPQRPLCQCCRREEALIRVPAIEVEVCKECYRSAYRAIDFLSFLSTLLDEELAKADVPALKRFTSERVEVIR